MKSVIIVRIEKNEKVFITFLEDTCVEGQDQTVNFVAREGDYLVVERMDGVYLVEVYKRRAFTESPPYYFSNFIEVYKSGNDNIKAIEFSGLTPFKDFFKLYKDECPSVEISYTKAEL